MSSQMSLSVKKKVVFIHFMMILINARLNKILLIFIAYKVNVLESFLNDKLKNTTYQLLRWMYSKSHCEHFIVHGSLRIAKKFCMTLIPKMSNFPHSSDARYS